MITCLNRNEIESNGGQIITSKSGTISVYNNAGIPTLLTKPCCEAIGGIFDVDTQKCMSSKKSSESSPFNIILNPRGNSGEIFYVTPDEACTLQVSFDFLFKFNCEALKTMNSDSVITMFESIFAGMTINTKNGASIDKVYEETIFNKIDTGNCYAYISSAGTDTGFYICGDLSENTVTNDCLPLNLYSLKTNNGTLDCKNAQQFIVEGLFKQSGLATTEFDQFKFNINENAFASNWLNFKTEITDASVLSAITNQKIVLAIKVSGAPEHLSILIDNIELNKVCKKLGKTTFLSSSPGFELDRIKDNKKSWVANTTRTHREFDINRYDDTLPIRQTDYYLDDERQVINTKEIDLDINLAHAVESDVWCYITSNPCILTGNTVGTTICSGQVSTQVYTSTTVAICSAITITYCCSDSCGDKPIDINSLLTQPLSAVTTIEDFEYFLTSELIDAKNRQTITSYPTLRLLYDRYMNSLNYCGIKSSAFDYYTMEKFSKLIGNYWTDLIEQVIPATTIWNSTKVYTNTIFDEQKYKYKGYTSLFGTNPCDDVVPLSPTTGTSCGIDVKTVFVQGGPQNTLQFLRELNVSEYDRIYLLQMNSSNEFLGNVSSTNRSSSCYNIAECTLAIDITHVDETYPLNNGSATVNIYGANGTPSILWSNGQTTNTITGLSGGTYSVKVTDSVCDKTASVTIKPSTQPPTLTWSAYTFSCETETTFAIRKTISGLSSPFSAFYYTGTTPSRVYIADGDSTKGNIYWFDPKTATTESHMNYYSGIKANNVYTTFFDSKYLRAYLIGSSMTTPGGSSTASTIDVSGLTVYDITGNTHYVVPYGDNTKYKRQTILVTNDYIFTIDSTISPSGGYRRFNRANPLSANTAIPYPSGQLSYWQLSTGGDGAPQPFEVGDKIWLIAGSGNNNGNIGIFDTSFNYLTQIVLPVKTNTGFTTTDKYWQNGYYDKTYNRFYVNEVNGKYRYVFEPNAQYTGATCIMSGSVTPYLENKKSFVNMSWSVDPVTNNLYNIFALGNNDNDGYPIYKTYEINRSSGELLKLYSGYSFAELVQVNDGLFDSLAGTQAGSVYWQTGTNPWNTDGQVVLYNNSISGNTTGRVSVKTLELYSNNNPTGTIKDNQIGTEGYIAPYTDYTTCPPYFDLRCPTILKTASGTTAGYAEVQLAQSVQNNPVITKITISALTSGYSAMTSTSYTPPFSGYTFVTFTGLPATLGNVGVTYYSGGSPSYVQISACTT